MERGRAEIHLCKQARWATRLRVCRCLDLQAGRRNPNSAMKAMAMIGQRNSASAMTLVLCLLASVTVVLRAPPTHASENAAARVAQLATPASGPTFEQMIGQMVMVGFFGTALPDPGVQTVLRQLQQGKVGGVLYLRDNVSSLDKIVQMNDAFLRAQPGLPPFIAVDQEGGFIQRLKGDIGFPDTLSAKRMAAQGVGRAWRDYTIMARALRAHGFNLNLGPVVDLETNPDNPIIARYRRAYSADPGTVSDYAAMFIQAHHASGVLTALKHFPGHGSSQSDTHLGFTDISASWVAAELEPYRALLGRNDLNIDMVMAGHLYHSGLNRGGEPRTPATLSPQVMQLLRGQGQGQLGYGGVVITDDLRMGAIREHFSQTEALLAAVRAGNDILMYSALGDNMAGLPDWVIRTLSAEAQRDPQFARMIVASYNRIVTLKQRLQNLPTASAGSVSVPQPQSSPQSLPQSAPQQPVSQQPVQQLRQVQPPQVQQRQPRRHSLEPAFDPAQ
jgi:beta-N-acetylhexosaminidase